MKIIRVANSIDASMHQRKKYSWVASVENLLKNISGLRFILSKFLG